MSGRFIVGTAVALVGVCTSDRKTAGQTWSRSRRSATAAPSKEVISMLQITVNNNQRVQVGGMAMKIRIAIIVSCGVCFALLGCAGEQRRFSGFLRDYSVLKPHPATPGALVYWNPNIDSTEYKAVLVEPVDIHFRNRYEQNRAKPEEVAAFRRFVNDELTAAISKHATIVAAPGPNVLRYRLQVSNLQLTRSLDEPHAPFSPQYFVLGTASIEADVRDSISGELVAAYVGPRGSAKQQSTFLLSNAPDRWEAAKTVVRNRVMTIGELYSHRVINQGDRHVAYNFESQSANTHLPARRKIGRTVGG